MAKKKKVAKKKQTVKSRVLNIDNRTESLFKRYPLVGATVLMVGFFLGLAAGALIWAF